MPFVMGDVHVVLWRSDGTSSGGGGGWLGGIGLMAGSTTAIGGFGEPSELAFVVSVGTGVGMGEGSGLGFGKHPASATTTLKAAARRRRPFDKTSFPGLQERRFTMTIPFDTSPLSRLWGGSRRTRAVVVEEAR